MTAAALIIAAADLARIEEEVRRSLPREACGLLIGTEEPDGTLAVSAVIRSENVAPEADRFEIDPALLLSTHRTLRGGPAEIIGHYHSHPGGPARPSAHDRAVSFTPGLVWLILGVEADAIAASAFRHPKDGPVPPERFEPVAVRVRQ